MINFIILTNSLTSVTILVIQKIIFQSESQFSRFS